MRNRFRNPALFDLAMTHSSSKLLPSDPDYERLEFLGDAILQHYVTALLYARYPERGAGELTELRKALVSEGPLARIADREGLGASARLGKGEEQAGGRTRARLLANLYEAVLAAFYLDQGPGAAEAEVVCTFEPLLDALDAGETLDLPVALPGPMSKNELQEWTQDPKRGLGTPIYELLDKRGADHQPVYEVSVAVDGRVLARGEGPKRKLAEADAATKALALLRAEADSAG